MAAWSAQEFLFQLAYPGVQRALRRRQDVLILVAALGLMVLLFGLARTTEDSLDFTGRFGTTPFVLQYRLVVFAYLGIALLNVLRLSHRYATLSGSRPSLQTGLYLVAAGAVVGLGYVINGIFYLLAQNARVAYPLGDGKLVSAALVAGSIGLLLIGSTTPAWGPRLSVPALHGWLSRYLALRRLYPRWRDLCDAVPDAALTPPVSALVDALMTRDLGFRLYRRVVEIRDARLVLRTYVPPTAAERAQSHCHDSHLPPEEEPAVVEAAALATAVRTRKSGLHGAWSLVSPPTLAGVHLTDEVNFLCRVAWHYRHSAIVRSAVAEVTREKASAPLGVNA